MASKVRNKAAKKPTKKTGKKTAVRKAVNRAVSNAPQKAAKKAVKRVAKKAVKKAAKKTPQKGAPGNLLAKGGGAAPAAGVTFQGFVGGLSAAIGLTRDPVDQRLQLGAETVTEFRFETAAPIDDLMIYTTAPGRLFVQAKTNLSMAQAHSGDMVKTLDQMVRQWRLCSEGKRKLDWDYALDKDHDRFVIAVSPESPDTVAVHLAKALARRREGRGVHPTPQTQKSALDTFTTMLKEAWKRLYGTAPTKRQIDDILDLVVVAKFDFDGGDFGFGAQLVKSELVRKGIARSAFKTLAHECEERMKRRTGFTVREVRRVLERNGIELLAPEDYRQGVAKLQDRSGKTQKLLGASTKIDLGNAAPIPIPRAVVNVAKVAAKEGSFLVVGEPGSGKTGVVVNLAEQLTAEGRVVLLLKVSPSGLTGLKSDLGLAHSLPEILENWPGTAPAYLLIDGLDEARGGTALTEYRDFIADILALPDRRWTVIASVRSFDLRAGIEFKTLFKGTPPNPDYAAPGLDFSNVRHIEVRPWSETEFKDLLKKAPKLQKAVRAGGQRLREIALVPFNTQLLAEVISSGITDQELGLIRNQTDLLARYWAHRVDPLGAAGKACLTATVDGMVEARGLEVDSAPLEAGHGNAFDRLQQRGVLVPRRNRRQIAFRHNILFDYAASKLYLDPFNPGHLQELLLRDRGLGLILGPALGYALQELWSDEVDHALFWDLVILLVSDKNIDPIARGLAARRTGEFTKTVADIQQLAEKLTDTQQSASLVSSLVGAYTILLEDSPELAETAPWAYLAEKISTKVCLVGSLPYLIDKLLKRQLEPEPFNRLGKAARNLLGYALSAIANPNFVAVCIPLVADTYSTDPAASRALLERVFDPERLEKFAYIEVPALARKIAEIAKQDTEFAVSIYARTFAHRVDSERTRSFNREQIMPMSGRESDMYGTASYSLAQHFPKFFEDSPAAATEAVVAIIEGHVATRHAIAESVEEKSLQIGGTTAKLIDDGSRYWSWEIDLAHPDATGMILLQHMTNLQSADEEKARQILSVLLAKNRTAFLWSRLFEAGAQRPELYASLLWELVTHEEMLFCNGTRQHAIEAIAAFYPSRSEDRRKAFEEKVLAHGEDDPVDGTDRNGTLNILFQTIGEQHLETDAARALSVPEPGELPAVNGPAISIRGGAFEYGLKDHLMDQGVDLEVPEHSALLVLIDEIKAKLRLNEPSRPPIEDISGAVAELRRLATAITEAEGHQADANIVRAARELLGTVNLSILDSAQKSRAAIADGDLSTIRELALALSNQNGPGYNEALRQNAVSQLYCLSRYPATSAAAVKRLVELASDSSLAVRHSIVQHLWVLNDSAPAKMWKLAESFAKNELAPPVLAQLVASTLRMLRNHDPGRIESMVLRIRERFPYEIVSGSRGAREPLWEHTAQVMAALYVWNDRTKSRDQVFDWAVNPVTYVDQIRNAVFEVRQAVTQGYDADTPEFQAARERIHALLAKVVDYSATALEAYHALSAEVQNEKQAEARAFAHALEYACAPLFFASGAHNEKNLVHASPILTDAGKGRFVKDVQRMLRRLGDIAIPHTVYELVQILDYLLPGEPALCFDLFAHALTVSGQKYGFQWESIGVDVLVRVVSRSLADYDYIFSDRARREKLIACLDIFIEAGWPNALRLLYRLPDSLR